MWKINHNSQLKKLGMLAKYGFYSKSWVHDECRDLLVVVFGSHTTPPSATHMVLELFEGNYFVT